MNKKSLQRYLTILISNVAFCVATLGVVPSAFADDTGIIPASSIVFFLADDNFAKIRVANGVIPGCTVFSVNRTAPNAELKSQVMHKAFLENRPLQFIYALTGTPNVCVVYQVALHK